MRSLKCLATVLLAMAVGLVVVQKVLLVVVQKVPPPEGLNL